MKLSHLYKEILFRSGLYAIKILGFLPRSQKNILIVKRDNIGDYLLFRNFLKILKENTAYQDKKIYILGNSISMELAELLDTNEIEAFFTCNNFPLRSLKSLMVLIRLNFYRFHTILNPLYSRDEISDFWVRNIEAKSKIAFTGDDINYGNKIKKERNDKIYTKRLVTQSRTLFEFERNKEFFENILNHKILLNTPSLPQYNNNKEAYIVVFPGASHPFKRWDVKNFIQVIDWLSKYDLDIYLTGGALDIEINREIMLKSQNKRIIDLTSKTSLLQLIEIISKAFLLITNDTVSVHIAAMTNTQAICIAKGDLLGRFIPYPSEMTDKINVIFPDQIEEYITKQGIQRAFTKYNKFSEFDINSIQANKVITLIAKYLG